MQVRAVAELRYGDACALRDTKRGNRAIGAIYLAGLSIEISLKARMLSAYPWLAAARDRGSLRGERAWLSVLFWKSHNLGDIAQGTPGALRSIQDRGGFPLVEKFKRICSEWSIALRYQSKPKTVAEAVQFIAVAEEIKKCLCQ